MTKPYDLLTLSVSEVQKSTLPPIKRLQIEVQLYQLKRVLITAEQSALTGRVSWERDLTVLHDRIKHVCRRGAEPGEANELVRHMMALKEAGLQVPT